MIYFIALIPATALTIAGYFVLYLSNRSEGAFRTFGKYLGFWAFTLAALVVLGAIFAAAHHGGRHGPMMGPHGMYRGMPGPWPGEPRFFGPQGERPEGGGPPGEGPRTGPPQPGAIGTNPAAAPAPAPPAPR
jgi:hypothetical protein